MKSLVRQYFNFLVESFGFVLMREGLGYKKDDLEIEFYSGKGEVDIVLFVRRDDEVFRPYVSRSFDLMNVLQRYANDSSFDLTKEGPPSSRDVEGYLAYCSNQLERYGVRLLEGDLSVLEAIHLARREQK